MPPPPRGRGKRMTPPRNTDMNFSYQSSTAYPPMSVTITQVKEEIVSPVHPVSAYDRRNAESASLSTPPGDVRQFENMMMTTSPPIFSMDALTDVMGDMVCSDESFQDTPELKFRIKMSPSSVFLNDMSTIEQEANSVATDLFNAYRNPEEFVSVHPKMEMTPSKNALPDCSLSQYAHPLFETLMSPSSFSRCSSPIYTTVKDLDRRGGKNGGNIDSSSSSNDSEVSDSDFELGEDSSPPSDSDSSDSDFHVDDSDSDYGAKRRRGGSKSSKKRKGFKLPIQGLGLHKSRRPPNKSKSKEKVVLLMGNDQPMSKPINAHQLEAIAATMGSSPVTVNWLLQNYETSEGNSLPRALMYGHYLRHCAELRLDPVNAASFGKLIRSVFVGLTTRRLGTRGNSKYHYCGIRIKDSSTLLLEDPDLSKKTRTNGKRSKKTQILAMQGGICGLGGTKGLQLEVGSSGEIDYNSVKKYLGSRCASFPDIAVSEFYLPEGVSYQDMLYFAEMYRKHCLDILEAAELFKLGSDLEKIWYQFWQRSFSVGDQYSSGIVREALVALTKVPEIQFAIQNLDAFTYDQVLSVLMPNVIAQLPFQLLQEYHKLCLSIYNWLANALKTYSSEFTKQKLDLVKSFKHELECWISLNLSAQAARDSMQSPNSIAQLLSDLNRINFKSVLMDVKEYVNVEEMDINVHESLKRILSGPDSIEPWSVWLVGLVDQRLGNSNSVRTAHDGDSTMSAVVKECQDLSLRWLKYMSQLKLELLLRSSGSLGTFLSLELLFSNFLLHLIKVYKSRALQVPLVMYSIARNTKEPDSSNSSDSIGEKVLPGGTQDSQKPCTSSSLNPVRIKEEII